MKTATMILTGLSLLAVAGGACAQDDRKMRNDPTYSTSNYKHANKAATARRWEKKTEVAVQQPTATDNRLADYKKQVPNQEPAGGITVDHTPMTDVADRNYKIQRPNQPRETPNETFVKRKKDKGDNGSVIGNED
ncbi:hypothetical protein [Spirosoma pomorum]|jgi:spermidine/putrescine-binding protein